MKYRGSLLRCTNWIDKFNDILIFDVCSDIAVIMAANNYIMAYLFIY